LSNTLIERETTVTRKGQVTIPAEIRSHLGLKPRDRVVFELEGDSARLRPARSRIARHFGAVEAVGEALDARAEREAFEEGVAEAAASGER
jgi:AbrB family looped-hinge helix DNA binding protein